MVNDKIISADFNPSRSHPFKLSTAGSTFPFIALQPVSSSSTLANGDTNVEIVSESKDLFENHAGSLREDPIAFARQLTSWTSSTGWRSYTDYIGTFL